MDPVLKQQNDSARFIARVLAVLVAGLLSLQVVFAGAAVAAADSGSGAMFGVVCATPQSAPDGASPPADTRQGHRHGLCCILHCGVLDAPTPKPQAFRLPFEFPAQTIAFLPATCAPEPRIECKGAPQSPRPPPVQG